VFKGTPLDEMQFHLQSNNSSISGCDISYFLPDSCKFNNEIIIDGKVNGNLAQLNGDYLHLMMDSIVDIHSTFEIQHLNDPEKLSFNIELADLLIDIVGAADFFNHMMPHQSFDVSPYAYWEEFSYHGNISGVNNNFTTKGEVRTKFGTLNTDVFVALYDSLNTIEYNGDISTQGFHLGQALLNTGVLGDASAQLFVSGSKQRNGEFTNYFKGGISEVSIMDYDYSGITLEGGVGRGYFNGNLNVEDENANFDFSGKVDYLSSTPVFNFTLDMEHLAMSKLNLTTRYDQLDLNFQLDSRLEGKRIDDLNGYLDISELWVVTEHDSFNSDSVLFSFKPLDAMPSIVLSSEYIDGLILGSYNFSEFLGYFNTSLKKHLKYLPQLFKAPQNITPNEFDFAFEIDDMKSLATTLDLPLRANGFSTVSGEINSRKNIFNLEGEIPYLLTKDQMLDSVTFAVSNNDQSFESEFNIERFIFGGDHLMNAISIGLDIQEDTILFSTVWDNESEPNYTGGYQANIWLEPYGNDLKTVVESQASEFIIADTLWHINKNQVSFLPHRMLIDSLIFANAHSYFSLDGIASENISDTMRFEMDQFDLGHLDRFLSIRNFTFDGILSGKAELYSLLKEPVFVTDLRVDSISLNTSEWGTLSAVTEWDAEKSVLQLYVDCESALEGNRLMSLSGAYHKDNDSLAVVGDLSGFDIAFLRPYLDRTLSHLTGLASGQIDVKGSIKDPELYGALMVRDGSFGIDYLSTELFMNDSIKFDKNRFVFDATQVQDQEGNYARVTGDIVHTRYKDMLVDLIIESDKFLGLNTTAIENEYFFGDIYFGGIITIKSTHQQTVIASRAKTMPGSLLTVPLSPVSTAATNNFINYVVNEKEEDLVVNAPKTIIKEVSRPARALIIDMNFNVTSDATLRLEFDDKSGDAIEAVGNGNLNIQFQRGQPFQMFGEYKIDRGDYLFTMQQIFNKKFHINSGSTLQWSGKPGDAIMDITAQYPLRASLYNLMPEAIGESNKNRRVPVNVKMLLTERLSQPDIGFDIELPNTDEETQQSVSSIINTEEEMIRQVISLLIMNSFYTPDYYADNTSGSQTNNRISSAAAVTASEFLSNQLSNWMSDISNNLDLGFRYVPEQELIGEGLTPEEYEVAISTQFFDDRLTVNGNVNYQDYATDARPPNLNSNFVGEVDVELKINEYFKAKAYSHQNDDILYESSSMKQGVGVTYQE
ncbi:MAG: translocation/assembly module TamB domain-containing protein, partial [Bacteroidales bacterium]|nr:translocation/assembly module TamB domain-containing protein [Bacteroidales bacterium]